MAGNNRIDCVVGLGSCSSLRWYTEEAIEVAGPLRLLHFIVQKAITVLEAGIATVCSVFEGFPHGDSVVSDCEVRERFDIKESLYSSEYRMITSRHLRCIIRSQGSSETCICMSVRPQGLAIRAEIARKGRMMTLVCGTRTGKSWKIWDRIGWHQAHVGHSMD